VVFSEPVVSFRRGKDDGDFRGRADVWPAHFRHSLLRGDRLSAASRAEEWATLLRNIVLYRLAVVQRAREMGFTLDEIREVFFGFEPGTSPPKRWHQLSK